MKKEDVKVLREVFLKITNESNDQFQMFHRFWEILDYLERDKTPEFCHRIEKEYPEIKKIERD